MWKYLIALVIVLVSVARWAWPRRCRWLGHKLEDRTKGAMKEHMWDLLIKDCRACGYTELRHFKTGVVVQRYYRHDP